jgi:16S rRNA (cytosine967-C5)-methyltransferase
MPLSPARRAAFEILRRVEEEGAYASLLLAAPDQSLRDDDRGLCHELVLGVLRRQLWLDSSLEHFANRRTEKLDLPVKLALRLGLYQLRFLSRIPASAAVNESVKLVRAAGLTSAASFANAVLRRATREPEYDPAQMIVDPVEKLSIETSHPAWLIDRWTNAFGFAEAAALARSNNEPAPVAFRLTAKSIWNGDQIQRIMTRLAAAGVEVQPSKIAPDSWRVSGHNHPLLRDLAREGLIYFQDEASQLVSHVFSPHAGELVLDACAAPGSKTTHIAALSPRTTVVAVERHEHRVKILRESAATQGNDAIKAILGDAAGNLPLSKKSFDRVLVDAPCSGTGTLRHNPEIRWRLSNSDIKELSSKQSRILENAAEMVRPGGILLYSTCSVEPEEDEAVADAFLRDHTDFDQVPPSLARDLITNSGALRTWPQRHDVDGFFMVMFQRRI